MYSTALDHDTVQHTTNLLLCRGLSFLNHLFLFLQDTASLHLAEAFKVKCPTLFKHHLAATEVARFYLMRASHESDCYCST